MRGKRIDANQPQLVKQMRKLGLSVAVTSALGNGFVDAVVGYQGVNYLCEIKDPGQPPSKRKLTPDEQYFHTNWKGQVKVIENINDVLKMIVEAKTMAVQTAEDPARLLPDG